MYLFQYGSVVIFETDHYIDLHIMFVVLFATGKLLISKDREKYSYTSNHVACKLYYIVISYAVCIILRKSEISLG